jgi:hypothetical protein
MFLIVFNSRESQEKKNYGLALCTFPKKRNIKSKKIMTKAYLHSRSPKAPTSFAHENPIVAC